MQWGKQIFSISVCGKSILIKSHLIQQIPILQEILQKKEQVLTELSNNHSAETDGNTNCQNEKTILEVKRQHEAIKRAIDVGIGVACFITKLLDANDWIYSQTLNCVQAIVDQWSMPKVEPAVDNIDTLNNSASSADCNANGPNNESVQNSDTNSPNNTIDLSV